MQGRMIPIVRWADYHAWPSVASLRKWYTQDVDGFRRTTTRAPSRTGRNGLILIDEDAFFAWLRDRSVRDAS